MPVKIEMDFKETLDYVMELIEVGKSEKAEEVAKLLEVEVNNMETRMKNAELELRSRRNSMAVGETPPECIKNFTKSMGWLDYVGEQKEKPLLEIGSDLELTQEFDWAKDFFIDGEPYKAAGVSVPGGYILTWYQ